MFFLLKFALFITPIPSILSALFVLLSLMLVLLFTNAGNDGVTDTDTDADNKGEYSDNYGYLVVALFYTLLTERRGLFY